MHHDDADNDDDEGFSFLFQWFFWCVYCKHRRLCATWKLLKPLLKVPNVHHQWRTSRLIRESTYNRPLWRIIHSDSLKNRWRFFFFWEVGKRINFRRVSSNWPRMLRSSFQPKPSTSWPWAEFSLLQDVGFLSSKCYEGPGISNGPFSLSQLFFDVFFFEAFALAGDRNVFQSFVLLSGRVVDACSLAC